MCPPISRLEDRHAPPLRLRRRIREPDPTRLHPPARQHLRLDHHRAADPRRDPARLHRIARKPVIRHRNPRPPHDLARLVLVEPHRPPRSFGRPGSRTLPGNTNVQLRNGLAVDQMSAKGARTRSRATRRSSSSPRRRPRAAAQRRRSPWPRSARAWRAASRPSGSRRRRSAGRRARRRPLPFAAASRIAAMIRWVLSTMCASGVKTSLASVDLRGVDRPLALVAEHGGAARGGEVALGIVEVAERPVDRAQPVGAAGDRDPRQRVVPLVAPVAARARASRCGR